jgi:hypothetical protein
MALTFFDVGGRKLLSNSITGSLELTELLMVVVIFAALPLVSIRREHVVFDSLDHMLPARLRKLQDAGQPAVRRPAGPGLADVAHRAMTSPSSGETTAQLKLLKAPFIYGMACCVRSRAWCIWHAASPCAAGRRAAGGAL